MDDKKPSEPKELPKQPAPPPKDPKHIKSTDIPSTAANPPSKKVERSD
jgi:hypothetical protein